MHILIGALVGAVIGAIAAVVVAKLRGRPVTWQGVAAGAIGGLVGGAITAATLGAGTAAGQAAGGTIAAELSGMAVGGAVGGGTQTAAENALTGRPIMKDVPESVAIGLVAAPVFGQAGKYVVAGARRMLPAIGRALGGGNAGASPPSISTSGLVGALEDGASRQLDDAVKASPSALDESPLYSLPEWSPFEWRHPLIAEQIMKDASPGATRVLAALRSGELRLVLDDARLPTGLPRATNELRVSAPWPRPVDQTDLAERVVAEGTKRLDWIARVGTPTGKTPPPANVFEASVRDGVFEGLERDGSENAIRVWKALESGRLVIRVNRDATQPVLANEIDVVVGRTTEIGDTLRVVFEKALAILDRR